MAAPIVSVGTLNMTELAAGVGASLAAGDYANVGVGISGTGLLVFFLLGALEMLREAGMTKTGATPFAGSSGGAVLALAQCTGVSNAFFYNESVRFTDFCAGRFNCLARFDPALRESIDRSIAAIPGGARRAFDSCNGRTFMQLSVASHPTLWNQGAELGPAAARLFGDGTDPKTQAVPLIAPNPALQEAVIQATDALAPKVGGLPNAVGRQLCSTLGSSPALRAAYAQNNRGPRPNSVTPWVVSEFSGVADGVDAAMASSLNPLWSGPTLTTTYRGVRNLVDGVYSDPLPCPPLPPAKGGSAHCIRLSAVPPTYAIGFSDKPIVNPTIAPGMRTPMRLSPEELMCYNFVIPTAEVREEMYELGRAEARAFVDEVEAASEWRRAQAAEGATAP